MRVRRADQATARESTTSEFRGPRCSRAPCSVRVRPVAAPDKAKRPCGPHAIWNCRTHTWIGLQLKKAWGHTAHRGWARLLLLNRARDLIIHGPVHRGANDAAMPTDEDDQDAHFFFNHPERGGYLTRTNTTPYGTEASAAG